MTAPKERWIQRGSKVAAPPPARVVCGRDKSLTHRAVMFAALASGLSRIHFPLLGEDCLSTMACFRALGVRIEQLTPSTVAVVSQGFRSWRTPSSDLDCGNSGTTARLMTGILAAQEQLRCRLIGDASLSERPMKRVVEPLRRMGARIEGREGGNFLPLVIEGQALKAATHQVDKSSAQVKSALLLAGLFTQGTTTVSLPEGSRDHTERLLLKMGAKLERGTHGGVETVSLKGPFEPLAGEFYIPVDPSSAAFFAVYALLRSGAYIDMPEVLDNPTRTGFLRILERMSSGIETFPEADSRFVEPVMRIRVHGGQELKPADIAAREVPTLVDEIPILAVAAAFAKGPSRFSGLEELRVKESDRLSKTAELLRLAGAKVSVEGDDLLIGGSLKEVKAFTFDSVGDHRLAMAAAILARFGEKPSCILNSECVGVSFPDFYEVLDSVS